LSIPGKPTSFFPPCRGSIAGLNALVQALTQCTEMLTKSTV
jgi:hypothetical protein